VADEGQLKALKTVFASRLKERESETVQWWFDSEEIDGSIQMWGMAQLYRQEYQRTLPSRGGKKAPSHVTRELAEIRSAIDRLVIVLGTDLSPEAEEALRNVQNGFLFDLWLPLRDMRIPLDGQPRLMELESMAACITAIPKGTKRRPPHSWLVLWIAHKLQMGRKPKSHVLPIAQAIHYWATKEPVSSEWGDEFLRDCWPPSKRTG
jgi:hypothetical protein